MATTPVISIVDDDPSARQSVSFLIRSLGYVAATFASAEEFLKSERAYDTACLISDVKMPGMNGIELQKELLARSEQLPVIFMTAYAEDKFRDQAFKQGAVGFLGKPFREEALIAYLDKVLDQNRAGNPE
jgi:FixJ family two-component response regulator